MTLLPPLGASVAVLALAWAYRMGELRVSFAPSSE
jgi:hypothetical protein